MASDGPRVVALGGGHGLSAVLRAVRRYSGEITAVVSVADDGGSSGRLRRDLGVPPPGDIRRCLVALAADDNLWSEAFEHRFGGGELSGHALGNLLLVGLAEVLGSFPAALEEAGRLLGAVGRVLPATVEPVVLKADVAGPGLPVEGQVAVARSTGIRRVALVPADAATPPDVVAALEGADQVILAPGSLYTSLLPVLVVGEVQAAIRATPARVVMVANLAPQVPETLGLDAADQLSAVLAHGGRVDSFLVSRDAALDVDHARIAALGVDVVEARLAAADGLVHDPRRLAITLHALL